MLLKNFPYFLRSELYSKGGEPGPDAPKMQALPEWGGGPDPCLDFCEGFVHMHWGPSKVIIHHPEVIISKQRTVLKYNNNQFQFIEINY